MEHVINRSAANDIQPSIHAQQAEDVRLLVKGRGLIVEFVGPTGAGKTTNCLYFLQFFRERHINAYAFADVKAFLYRLHLVDRVKVYLQAIFIGSALRSYCSLLVRHGVYSLDAVYRYLKLCIFNRAMHRFIRQHDVDVLFLDQWIIQGLWSATIFKNGASGEIQDALRRFYFKSDYVLYFDLDEDTACDRIHLRDNGKSRFDKMDKGRRLSELRKTTPYLYRLFENCDCLNKFKFSARNSVQRNAEDFLHHLKYSLSED